MQIDDFDPNIGFVADKKSILNQKKLTDWMTSLLSGGDSNIESLFNTHKYQICTF